MPTTVIRSTDWVIAWDEAAGRQVYRRGVDLAFSDDRIVFLGRGFPGAVDRVIDGTGLMVMPGLVDIHSHPHHEPLYRGIREEHGVANMHMTGLYERGQAFSAPDDEARAAGAEFAYCELLLSGVTSLVDISAPWDGWVELFAKSGMRGFLAPGYASARWFLENDLGPSYDWNEARGRDGFARALAVIDHAAARERGLPFTTHCSQSVNEVREMIRRHGVTPIQWADRLGLLGPGTILGHALFLDTHSWVSWHGKADLRLLGDSGTAVAHCPTPFARYGQVMEHFGAYRDAGVVMGMGTDCSPHNLIEEMRKASVLARIAARDIHAVDVADFFHAATAGGATALMRDDIGRLAPGKKADLVLVDLACPQMRPARDPLRGLVYHAADRAVRDVFVDGLQVVADRRVLTLDQTDAAVRLSAAQERMEAAAPQHDYRRRRAEEIAPLSLPLAE